MAAVLRIEPLDGTWETLGADRLRGVAAENLEARSNEWGPERMTFELKAVAPGEARPDLHPLTPVELEVGGMTCWSGRVRRRPGGEHGHVVHCEGWQYHLDDDKFERAWVHTRVADWRDNRTFIGSDLTRQTAVGKVQVGGGTAQIGWAKGDQIATNQGVGITLDLGPDDTAKRIVVEWARQGGQSDTHFYARAANGDDMHTAPIDDAFVIQLDTAPASTTSAGTFTTARRYVHLFVWYSGAGGTFGADVNVKIKAIRVFRSTLYESADASTLKADTIIKDALAFATLLNQSTAEIAAGSFSIPEALTQGYQSPRQVIEWANAYENFLVKVGGDDLKTLVFKAKPTAALLEVGAWSGSEFSDGSVSADDVYNKVIVQATGPDGARVIRTRTPANLTPPATTLPDRRGFTRTKVLPIRTAITNAVGDRFGELWLAEHVKAPFAGELRVSGLGVRNVRDGSTVPPYALLGHAGELIRLSHRADPDTDDWGRDGRIASVTYRPDTGEAVLEIDDRRGDFETILSRYGILVDQAA